ncbi:MAG: SusC/RagA family TonB-linked outer membrane protein, partial [Bacteroidales bacterium]|nr:SusC/RagA family TonB-linked outer membrane protein [Bacteroidales bacterium]
SLRTEFSTNIGMNNTYRFTPSYTFGAIHNDVRESSRTKSYNVYWSWRNVLTYNITLAEKHNISAMVGQEMSDSRWEYLSGYRSGFLTNGATDLDAGDATTAMNSGNSGDSRLLSFFGRTFYSYNDRYLLTATLRYDGTSKFDKRNRWALFPSAALAWKISNESFFKDAEAFSWINNLKLRTGWGFASNQNIPNNAYTSIMASVPTIWGTGMLSANTANPDVKWEGTSSINIGLDLNLFNNRIELIVDWYNKQTNNLLLQVPLPAYVGSGGQGSTSSPWVNIGSLQNRGIEFTLNTLNIDKHDFTWRSNFVISSNRNKVLSLHTESAALDKTLSRGSETTIITRTMVGQPIGMFYGYQVIGRFNHPTDMYYVDAYGNVRPVPMPDGVPISNTGVWIGDLMFADVNGDGIIDDADRTFIGNPEPKFTYGFGNTFSYKGFDLTIYLNGSYGNKVFNWIRRWTEDPRQSTNMTTHARNYARLGLIDPNGPSDDYRNLQVIGGAWDMPRLSPADANKNQRVSDRYIEDGSYLRIQNISLGYTFPKKWAERIYAENLKVYMNIQNLYTFTAYKGYDPELGSLGQDALLSGIDNARYPSPRIFTFGLNITF